MQYAKLLRSDGTGTPASIQPPQKMPCVYCTPGIGYLRYPPGSDACGHRLNASIRHRKIKRHTHAYVPHAQVPTFPVCTAHRRACALQLFYTADIILFVLIMLFQTTEHSHNQSQNAYQQPNPKETLLEHPLQRRFLLSAPADQGLVSHNKDASRRQ